MSRTTVRVLIGALSLFSAGFFFAYMGDRRSMPVSSNDAATPIADNAIDMSSGLSESGVDSIVAVKTLDKNRGFSGVIITPEQMRRVKIGQKVVVEGEACGVFSKGSSFLRLHFGTDGISERSRTCFYGGFWPNLDGIEGNDESELAYWVRIECCRVECGSVDFAEFCIDSIRIIGVSTSPVTKLDENILRDFVVPADLR